MTAEGTLATGQYGPLRDRGTRVLIGVLLLGVLLAMLDQTVTGTASITIVREMGAGLAMLPWMVTAYLIASTVVTPLFGRISDVHGRKRVYLCALAVFLAGSVAAGAAGSIGQFIAARVVQGIGAGGLVALTFAVIADVVPPRDRGRYTGLSMTVVGLASSCGPLLGGFFAGHGVVLGLVTDWRIAYWLNVPLGLLVAAVMRRARGLAGGAAGRAARIDYVGGALCVAGVGTILLAVEWASRAFGWAGVTTLAMLVGGAVLMAAFGWHEARTPFPILPVALLRNRTFALANLLSFVMGATTIGCLIYISLYLQQVVGLDPHDAGLHLMPLTFGLIVASVVAGRLMSATGRYRPFPIVGCVLGIAAFALLVATGIDTPDWLVALALFVLGAGAGLTTAVLPVAALGTVSPDRYGAVSASIGFSQSLGGACGVGVYGSVLTAVAADSVDGPTTALLAGVHTVFVVAGASLVVGLGLASALPPARLPGRSQGGPTGHSSAGSCDS